MEKKRWYRHIWMRVIVSVLTMLVVIALVSMAKKPMEEYTSSSGVTGKIPEYDETLDIMIYDPNMAEVEGNVEDVVHYLGATYTRYVGADILGSASVGPESIGAVEQEPSSGKGRHPAGTAVYEWQGYDPWIRIAVKGEDGGNYYYERWSEEELACLTMKEYLPQDQLVQAISIRKVGETLVGMITDPQVIQTILSFLREETEFSQVTDERVMDRQNGRYMDLVLVDGSTVRFALYDEMYGYGLREFSLPENFLQMLYVHEIYTIDESLGSTNYGGSLVAEWARPRVREVEPWVDGREVYTIGSIWVDENRLCMGYGGCFGPQASRGWTVLAEDVAGDLRQEDMEIWYRTLDGQVAHLYFWYPHGSEQFYDDLDAGVDFTPYVQEQRSLYEAPIVKLQVRDGVEWTLDSKGVLRKEKEIIATEVSCFTLDACGTIYGTADGLYRREEENAVTVKLAEGAVTTVTSGGMMVYYVTSEDQVLSVWIDGTHQQEICTTEMRELHCVKLVGYNGFSAGLIPHADCLLFIDDQDCAWLQRQGKAPVLFGENIQTLQYLDELVVWVQYTDGTQKNINLLNSLTNK